MIKRIRKTDTIFTHFELQICLFSFICVHAVNSHPRLAAFRLLQPPQPWLNPSQQVKESCHCTSCLGFTDALWHCSATDLCKQLVVDGGSFQGMGVPPPPPPPPPPPMPSNGSLPTTRISSEVRNFSTLFISLFFEILMNCKVSFVCFSVESLSWLMNGWTCTHDFFS